MGPRGQVVVNMKVGSWLTGAVVLGPVVRDELSDVAWPQRHHSRS